ncbi:unnamed protein product [Durusdinium trenchii]|uniref:Uncharacterized protein n=1 Tax=Durusdinium trenchii TaxID=1381693 RepID=A0ABP0KTN3_9DINO
MHGHQRVESARTRCCSLGVDGLPVCRPVSRLTRLPTSLLEDSSSLLCAGIDLEIDSEGESQRASTQKMSRPSEASEVLRASNSQARDVRLTSKELDDCRRDMLEDGCEVLAQEQARQARLELRSPQEVFFPREGHLLALGAPPCLTFCGDEENDLAASAAREASEDTQVHVAGLEEDARLRTGALEDDIQMHLIVALEEDARVLVTGAFFGKAQSCAPAKVP